VSPVRLLLIGLVSGTVTGLLGVGASTVVVPALTYWLSRPEHKAHGTTCLVVLPTALVGAWAYSRHGDVNWLLAANVAVGGAVGAFLGARLMDKLSPEWLRRIFATTALLAGWQMLRR
jgi:uncharacterized membrane protein YfcA